MCPSRPQLADLPQLLLVTGPTASGKSRLGIELAQRFGGEIVNGDSVQIYKDFDIGSGKPSASELLSCPHHLFSEIDPEAGCDAWQFVTRAREVIADIGQRGKLPIVVGGTGLYVRSLLCGLVQHAPVTDEDDQLAAAHESELRSQSATDEEFSERMYRWLESVDPLAAEVINPADLVRMRRALRVKLSSGSSVVTLRDEHAHGERFYRALVICVLPDRTQLYPRIDARVEQMLAQGLVEEVRSLRTKYSSSAAPFGAIGYRQVCRYLDGALDEVEMLGQIQRDTRRFAKRQYTWWNNQPRRLGWIDYPERPQTTAFSDKREGLIKDFLESNLELGPRGIAISCISRIESGSSIGTE